MLKTIRPISTCITPVALAAMAFAGTAQAQTPADVELTVINDCITECGFPQFDTTEEAIEWLREQAIADGVGGGAPTGAGGSPEGAGGPTGIGLGLGLGLNAPQTVFVSFETGEPTFSFPASALLGPDFEGVTITLPDYVYTQEDRDTIISRLEADYAPYNITFVTDEPTSGDYVTLQFNSNDDPGNGTAGIIPDGGILFGSAGEIDFGNDNRSIVAINDANLWPALNALDPFIGAPPGFLLEVNTGIDVAGVLSDGPDAVSLDEATRIAVINQSANTGAHELGHGLGLRHYDAFGPIGGGLPDTGVPEPVAFFPFFDAGQNADETTLHLMSSGASSGLSLAEAANADRFLSERSAIKLAINERGRFVTDEQANSGQAELKKLQVVNPILQGENADGRIDVRNIVVEGRIDTLGEIDTLTFRGDAGEVFNAEMISDVESAFFPEWDRMFGKLTLFLQERDGTLIEVATNDDEFESFDAFMLDVTLPEDGTYVLQAEGPADVFLGLDADGNPIVLPLALLGFETLRTGQYILNAYIVESRNGRGPSRIGGPRR
ncbi:MAG: hypothetical protein ACQET0_05685 [Pseudomonadota bacterium]